MVIDIASIFCALIYYMPSIFFLFQGLDLIERQGVNRIDGRIKTFLDSFSISFLQAD